MSVTMHTPARVNPAVLHPDERRLSLSGAWQFQLDPDDKGVDEQWFATGRQLTETIRVPGCWQGQGFGDDSKDTVWDFGLQARTFQATDKGTGWYARSFCVPAPWDGQRIWLNIGGVHPSAEVWVNGQRVGESHEPFVPFAFEITDLARVDSENLAVVRVHEQDRLLGLSCSFQGNWSGLYRDVELTATGACRLEHVWLLPDIERQTIRVKTRIDGVPGSAQTLDLEVSAERSTAPGEAVPSKTVSVGLGWNELELSVPDPALWSPDSPALYRVDAVLRQAGAVLDAASERTGFVQLTPDGDHFLINGEPYYIRGTGDFHSNPETGCPDTDRERWRRKLATLRAYGYNQVRCQSFVPAPEYFDAADEVGLLIQSEMGTLGAWGGQDKWHIYAWPQPTPAFRERLSRQWNHVVMRDVSHPSANLYCMSNELQHTHFPRTAWRCYHDTKAIKPTALVIWTDGGYSESLPQDYVNADARLAEQCTRPLIQHEFRWWSSFPDVRIMDKYSGAIRPYAAQIAQQATARHGIAHILPEAAANSQRLQLLEAKGKMEACRRDNPTLAGISHFNAMDTNPSPQGIVDEFYERKVADADTWLEANGDTVVLAGLNFDDRVLSPGDILHCDVYVSDFSHPAFARPTLNWRLTADDRPLASGSVDYRHVPYCTCEAGAIEVCVPEVAAPTRMALGAELAEGGRTVSNHWDLWVFPSPSALPEGTAVYGSTAHTWLKTLTDVKRLPVGQVTDRARGRVLLTEQLDGNVVAFAHAGGVVVLAASEGLIRPFNPKLGLSVGRYFFTAPANYGPYEDGNNGSIITPHPMLGDVPHEGFADLQFYRMIAEAPPLDLEPLGLSAGDPVLRAIHSYPVCYPLGYLLERRLGDGGIIVSALDLNPSYPEARYLLSRICHYAASAEFAPQLELSEDALARLLSCAALTATEPRTDE